jgi:ATP-dependent helicase HrpA
MWTQRDLRALREVGPLASTLASVDELQEQAFESIRRWATDPLRMQPTPRGAGKPAGPLRSAVDSASFQVAVEMAMADLRGLVPRFVDRLREILALRQDLLVVKDPPAGLSQHLADLLPPDFLARTPFEQLAHFPRYLKAMRIRAERWRKNPSKDAERVALLAPYEGAVAALRAGGRASSDDVDALRWLVEEFRVSLFAQELGTAEPVSAVKLDRALAALQPRPGQAGAPAAPPSAAKPIVTAPIRNTGPTRVKNFGALDKLFGR